jgi:hypothetical protein
MANRSEAFRLWETAPAVKRIASLIDPKKVIYGGKSVASVRYLDPTILCPIVARKL